VDDQFRLTCRKLVEESRRELELPGLAVGLDKDGSKVWLDGMEASLAGRSGEALKESLKELNQFILKLRMGRNQDIAAS
jgi:hypothetical protein